MSQGKPPNKVLPNGTTVYLADLGDNVDPCLVIPPISAGLLFKIKSYDYLYNLYLCEQLHGSGTLRWLHCHWVMVPVLSQPTPNCVTPPYTVQQAEQETILELPTEQGVKGSGRPYTASGPDAEVHVRWDDDDCNWRLIVDGKCRSTHLTRDEAIELARKAAGI